jgi:hypothetical protein
VWIEGGSGTASGSVEVTTQLAWMMTRGKGEGGYIIIRAVSREELNHCLHAQIMIIMTKEKVSFSLAE